MCDDEVVLGWSFYIETSYKTKSEPQTWLAYVFENQVGRHSHIS